MTVKFPPLATRHPGAFNIVSVSSPELPLNADILAEETSGENGAPIIPNTGQPPVKAQAVAASFLVQSEEDEPERLSQRLLDEVPSDHLNHLQPIEDYDAYGKPREVAAIAGFSEASHPTSEVLSFSTAGLATVINNGCGFNECNQVEGRSTTPAHDLWEDEVHMIRRYLKDKRSEKVWKTTECCGIPEDRYIKRNWEVGSLLYDTFMEVKFRMAFYDACALICGRASRCAVPSFPSDACAVPVGVRTAEQGNVPEEYIRRRLSRLLPLHDMNATVGPDDESYTSLSDL